MGGRAMTRRRRIVTKAGATPVLAAALAAAWLAVAAPAAAEGLEPATPASPEAAAAEDRYVGYYYPPPDSEETYGPRVRTLPNATERTRIAFLTGLTNQMLGAGYPPPFMIFAKGAGSRTMILVGLDDQRFATLYRIRAWLAGLTATARSTPVFTDIGAPPEALTFLDLCKLLGFEELVVSDGRALSHRIRLL